ncbi:MAG: hypothetical protein Mars2KO_19480 [Maribacter sp.]
MELKYIWVEEYKNLKNIDFNFKHSDVQEFSYDEGILNVTKLKSDIPKGFFGSNINGITTIVGKNGSGKTNLTELIHYSLSHVENGGLSTWLTIKGLTVLGDYIFIQEDIPIINEKDIKAKGYDIFRYKDAPLDKSQIDLHWSAMEKNKYIYYNPVFDFRVLPMGTHRGNLQNISTSYLAWNDLYHSNLAYKENADLLRSHERMEKLREADCFLDYSEIEHFISPLPKELIISIDLVSENALINAPYFSKDILQRDKQKEILQKQYEVLRELRYDFKFHYSLDEYRIENEGYGDKYLIPLDVKKEHFKGLFWVNFFCVFLKKNEYRFPEGFYRNFIYDLDCEIEDKALAKRLYKLKKILKKLVDSCEWFEKARAIKDFSDDPDQESIYDLFRHANFKTSPESNKHLFKSLIQSTNDLLENNLSFHYQHFNKYSSGEQKKLNFYSRFHWAHKEIIKDENDKYGIKGERVIILIDEGEVSLHPEWQRTFFKNSIDFLSKLFKEKELQLIFITHSPFVLSDIPKENVIFLDKDKDGNALKKKVEMEKTFGANIYSLLSDSFFMENGTIGEFAKKKIELAVEVLNSENPHLSSEMLKEVNYIIDSVGEPLIKQQLEILRSNALNDDKVSTLEKRIQELEDELDKSNDNN